MSTPPQLVPPSPGPDPSACAVCRSPLLPDQRYCLQCGARREGARLEFLDVLAEPQGAARPAPQTIASASSRGGGSGPRGWLKDGSVLGAAVLLVGTLVAGLLIGHWASGSDSAKGPSTQVVKLQGAGGLATDAAAADTGAAADTTTTATSSKKKKVAKAAVAKNHFDPNAAPVKVTPQSESQALNDTSGNEDLAPKDNDPNGENFDEIK
jgi:hypothetical protein